MKMTERQFKHMIMESVRQVIMENMNDDEMYPFEEYQNDYPNGDFNVSDMTAMELGKWCDSVGSFRYIFKGLRGWQVMIANTDSICNEIIGDLYNCSHIEHTHEMDYLLERFENEMKYDYFAVFKVVGANGGDYYIIYQEQK